ncbi:MAG: hypothetical protein ACQETX_13960 [Pseudomonadota bacterium]
MSLKNFTFPSIHREVLMGRVGVVFILLLLLLIGGGAVALMAVDIPPPTETIEKEVPEGRFDR